MGAGGGGLGGGGAIFVYQGTVIASNCTFTQNLAQAGAAEMQASATIAQPGSGLGGAIFNLNGTVALYNVTLSHNNLAVPNTRDTGRGAGGALYNLSLGQGSPAAKSDIYNSILSDSSMTIGNASASSVIPASDVVNNQQTGSAIVSATAPNLIFNATGLINTGSLITGTDPQLGGLADNGGLTLTQLPAASSRVIGLGDPQTCYSAPVNAVDQRGNRRPPSCTLGAVEAGAAPTLATGCSVGGPAPPPAGLALLGMWLLGMLAVAGSRKSRAARHRQDPS